MLENGRISTKQLAILVIYFIIGDMLLILPSLTAAASKQDAWLSGESDFLSDGQLPGSYSVLVGYSPI